MLSMKKPLAHIGKAKGFTHITHQARQNDDTLIVILSDITSVVKVIFLIL